MAAPLAAAAAPAWAGFGTTDVATSGAQFLKLGGGARAEGMAEAYTALPYEADAMYWNPAALSRIEGRSLTLMNSILPAGINYNFLGYGQKVTDNFGAGMSLQYLSQPPIDQTDSSGFATGSTFRPNDFAAAFGGAYTFHNEDYGILDGASFGATGKYISETITTTAHTFGFDVGWLSAPFRVLDREMRLAYVAQNIGGSIKFQQLSDELPTILRFGSSMELAKGWLLDLDVDEPLDNAPYFALGTEYRLEYNAGSDVRRPRRRQFARFRRRREFQRFDPRPRRAIHAPRHRLRLRAVGRAGHDEHPLGQLLLLERTLMIFSETTSSTGPSAGEEAVRPSVRAGPHRPGGACDVEFIRGHDQRRGQLRRSLGSALTNAATSAGTPPTRSSSARSSPSSLIAPTAAYTVNKTGGNTLDLDGNQVDDGQFLRRHDRRRRAS